MYGELAVVTSFALKPPARTWILRQKQSILQDRRAFTGDRSTVFQGSDQIYSPWHYFQAFSRVPAAAGGHQCDAITTSDDLEMFF